ncbi:hypothetical protein AEQU3_01476 [Aequorivita antarctica]|nr:hypothetical protein AEQU3_01476 [Aequorivita antarctica]
MKHIIIFLFCIAFHVTCLGQSNYGQSIKNYDEAIAKGDAAVDKEQFNEAINYYFAAEAFDPTKKDSVKAKVNRAFDAIEALRKKAEADKTRAENAEKNAKIQTKKAHSLTLSAYANEQRDKNPTVALRLVEEAIKIKDDPRYKEQAIDIFADRESMFYKTIVGELNDELVDNNAYTRHTFSKDGLLLAMANSIGDIIICDSNGLIKNRLKRLDSSNVNALAFSNDKTKLFIGTEKGNYYSKLDEEKSLYPLATNRDFFGEYGKAIFHPNDSVIIQYNSQGKIFAMTLGGESAYLDIESQIYNDGRDLSKDNYKNVKRFYSLGWTFSDDGKELFITHNTLMALSLDLNFYRGRLTFKVNYVYSYDEACNRDFLPPENYDANRLKDEFGQVLDVSSDGNKIITTSTFGNDLKLFLFKDTTAISRKSDFYYSPNTPNHQKIIDEIIPLKLYGNHQITALAFSPNGNRIVTGTNGFEGGIIELWNIFGERIYSSKTQRQWFRNLTFVPEENAIISVGQDGFIKKWALKESIIGEYTHQKRDEYHYTPENLAFANSPDGKKLATLDDNDTIIIWNINGTEIGRIEDDFVRKINFLRFSQDSRYLLGMYNSDHSDEFAIWTVSEEPQPIKFIEKHWENGDIAFWQLSPDGEIIVFGYGDGRIESYNMQGEKLNDFPYHKSPIVDIRFAQDREFFISIAEDDDNVILWDYKGNIKQVIQVCDGQETVEWYADISADGQTIVTGCDKQIRLWHNGSSTVFKFMPKCVIFSVNISPDGSVIYYTYYDLESKANIRVLDHKLNILKTIENIGTEKGHPFFYANKKLFYYDTSNNGIWYDIEKNEIVNKYFKVSNERQGFSPCTSMSKNGEYIFEIEKNTVYLIKLRSYEEFIKSGLLDELTPEQKKEYNID